MLVFICQGFSHFSDFLCDNEHLSDNGASLFFDFFILDFPMALENANCESMLRIYRYVNPE